MDKQQYEKMIAVLIEKIVFLEYENKYLKNKISKLEAEPEKQEGGTK